MEAVPEPDPGFLSDFSAFPPVFAEEAEDQAERLWSSLVQFSSVQSLSRIRLFVTP